MIKLEKRQALCSEFSTPKYDAEIHAELMRRLKSCQKDLKQKKLEPNAMKVLSEIDSFIKMRANQKRNPSGYGSDILMVDRKKKACNAEIVAANVASDPSGVNQAARGLVKPTVDFSEGSSSPLLYRETLGR